MFEVMTGLGCLCMVFTNSSPLFSGGAGIGLGVGCAACAGAVLGAAGAGVGTGAAGAGGATGRLTGTLMIFLTGTFVRTVLGAAPG